MPYADSENVRAALGAILRRRREALTRSLADVAEVAHLSPAYLSEVERGLKEVSIDLLLAIVQALGMSIADFYLELGNELGGSPATARVWPQDPRLQLRRATASLSPDALRTVADFSVYLAMRQNPPPRRRIGFTWPGSGLPPGIR